MDGYLRVGFGNPPDDLQAALRRLAAPLDALPLA
jgi:hypothetical protein